MSVVAAAILSPAASVLAHTAAVASGATLPGAIAAGMFAGKVAAGIAAGATATALSGGNAGVGALLGGIGGLLGPSLAVGFRGGVTGAIASGVVTGAAIGGLSTAFTGGNFGENVGLGALSGGVGTVGGILAGPVTDVLLKDAAATVTGLMDGNVLGAIGGIEDVLAGGITRDWSQVGKGVLSFAQAVIPRYDTAGGPAWGLPTNALTVLGQLFVSHDQAYRDVNVFFSRLTTAADLKLIREMWSVLPVGPVGQAYRLGATGAFSLKILGQEALGAAGSE